MINEARTLLLNISHNSADTSLTWSEYVPAEFIAVVLPAWLVTIRTILFGNNPTEQQLNQRVRQYMQILHAGDFADHLFALDNRITYLPFDADTMLDRLPLQTGIGPILATLKTTVHPQHQLFSGGEPFQTFKNLWNQHPVGLYQITGLLLAVIYRTAEFRTGVSYAR
jgi:hypothetical protein